MGQYVTAYRLDAFFEGTSVFFGYQANVSYEINDMISVAIGGRYITAKETYSGHLKDIEINLNGTWTPATTFFSGAAAQYTQAATDFSTAASALQPAIDGGLGDVALSDPTLIGTLTALDLYFSGMTNAQAQAAFLGASASAIQSAAQSTATATLLADQEVDAEKTASGFTPIVSVNIQPIDMLNIALRYEHKTKLEFTNSTPDGKAGLVDFESDGTPVYMFPDGEKTNYDLPALISVGATLRPIDALLISAGMNFYMEKGANWDGREDELDANTWDIGLGAEYALGNRLLVSAGYSQTTVSPGPDYLNDMSFEMSTSGLSFGLGYNILDNIQLNLGGQYVMYQSGERNFLHDLASSGTMIPVTETFEKGVLLVAAGLNISIAR
jgi:long-subunit fatty acid transport protein